MNELIYRPDVYEGKDPYVFVSFHPQDRDRVLPVLQRLNRRGFRFWINDGATPGMETDEIIAEHIEGCAFFVAFLSGSYLRFLDTLDELNYSRDVNKSYLLIYLEDVSLPTGLDMRFLRAQSVRAQGMSDDYVFDQLLSIREADQLYGVADPKLRGTAERLFVQLENLYPEHKVFALDAVDKQLSKEICELYVRAGYPSVERLMLDYGFEHVSLDRARSLRNSVLYPPGAEPDAIRSRIEYILDVLTAEYPDRLITDVLSQKHKQIYKSLAGLSVWMGYGSIGNMLNAYGFMGVFGEAGRRAVDSDLVIRKLQERYEGKPKPTSLTKLLFDNPALKGSLKTISNRSQELFGMPLHRYLEGISLIQPTQKERLSQMAKNRIEIVAAIEQAYEQPGSPYGAFSDVEDTLRQIVVKRNKAGQISVVDCSSCSETMRIPYGVDRIAKEAFLGQSDLVTLILPPTVKEIGEAAFADCSGLERIAFSEGIETLGNSAFSGCTSLETIALPRSLKAIGNEAFAGCEALREATFANPRINIQEDAFDDCPYELESLQDEDASPAEYFELKIDRKNNARIVAYHGDEAVVVIPGLIGGHPVTALEKGCFKGNEHVKEIYVSDHISAVNGDVFRDCRNLEKIHLPESVTALTATAFSGCVSLKEANVPDAMEDVQRGLFKDAPLTTLYVGKGAKRISPDAFYKGEADFATGMYLKKQALENLIVDTGNEVFRAENTMLLSKDGKVLIAELGEPVKAVVPEGVEEIGPQAFDRLSVLSEVSLPSTLRKIGEKAFAGTSLTAVELPRSLESVEAQAFSFCRLLSALEINEGLKRIGPQAFEGCPIADVYIPASVAFLGSDSFLAICAYQGQIAQRFRIDTANPHILADGVALYQRTPEGMVLVKAYAPELRVKPNEPGAEPLDYDVLPGTTAIAPRAFARCNNLRSILLPEGVLSIGEMAFWDCSLLAQIHVPQSCGDVSPKAFFGIQPKMI